MTQPPGEKLGKSKRRIPPIVRGLIILGPMLLIFELIIRWSNSISSTDPSQKSSTDVLLTVGVLLGAIFLTLGIGAGGLALLSYLDRREFRRIEHMNDSSSDLLDQFMPGLTLPVAPLPPRTYPSPAGNDGGLWAIVIVSGVASLIILIIAMPLIWLIAHSIIFFGGILLVVFGVLIRHWTMLKTYATEYQQGKSSLFDERYWEIVGIVVLTGIEATVLTGGCILVVIGLSQIVDNFFLSLFLAVIVLQIPLIQAVKWRIRLYIYWVYRALHQLDYERATARVMRMPGLLTPLRVYVLISQGRLEEAETLLYELVQKARLKPDKQRRYEILYLEQLAYLRFAQGDYKAINSIFEHIRSVISPKDTDGFILCAAAYLHLGVERPRAQAFADAAVNIIRKKYRLLRITDFFSFGEALAVQAWTLAQNNQPDQARKVAQVALAKSEKYLPLPRAGVLLNLGHMCATLGESDTARRYYEQAAALVPEGSVGQQARRALELMT